MRNFKFALTIIILSIILFTGFANASDKPGDKPFMKKIDMLMKKKNKVFNLSIDLQGGVNISKTTFDTQQDSSVLTNTTSKVGPTFGATLSVDLLGFGFTTGFIYTSKGFSTNNNENLKSNYFNIPLLLYFDFQIKKVIIEGNVGPYFGLLVSQTDNQLYKMKNFDLGITGNLQGTYMFHPMFGALLGAKFEYGGLNNLGNNEMINSIRTQTWFIYTGIKFVI